MTYTFFNDRIIPREQALIPVTDRSFRYGDGIFETIRLKDGIPCLWGIHRTRLARGLAALKIPAPNVNLAYHAQQLINANGMKDGMLRLHISRGSGSRGYIPHAELTPLLIMETIELYQPPASLRLWHSQWRRSLPEQLPTHTKNAQGLAFTLARMEAQEQGCNEALLTNPRNEVCEISSAALIWQLPDGTLATAAPSCGTMESVMLQAVQQGTDIRPIVAPLESLKDAVGIVACNAVWQRCVPVQSLAPYNWQWNGSVALAEKLNQTLSQSWPALHSLHQMAFLSEASSSASTAGNS